jgi:hypothetical protein
MAVKLRLHKTSELLLFVMHSLREGSDKKTLSSKKAVSSDDSIGIEFLKTTVSLPSRSKR